MPIRTTPDTITLTLPPEERWTLHHLLLHRIERETVADDVATVEPPPLEVFQAFDSLEAGDERFSVAQLEAIQSVLVDAHCSTRWEADRPRIERLLHRLADALEAD